MKMCVFVLALASGLIGVFGARLGSGSKYRYTMAFANAFASGVLVAAGLVCMLPDAATDLEKATGFNGTAYVVAGCAVMTLILVEEIAMWAATPAPSEPSLNGSSSGKVTSGTYTLLEADDPRSEQMSPQKSNTSTSSKKSKARAQAVLDHMKNSSRFFISKKVGVFFPNAVRNASPQESPAPILDSEGADCYQLIDAVQMMEDENFQALSCDGAMLLNASSLTSSKATCLFIALSFHSVMEGIGLGTQKTVPLLASISAAILAHKGLAAFALGTALCKSGISRCKFCAMAIFFSCGTPVGIGIGAVVAANFEGPTTSVFTAIAAGTFLQISLMEIIPSVLQPVPNETAKFRAGRALMIFVGFGMMCETIYLVGG